MIIPEGNTIPFGYGFAWRNWDSLTSTAYPIPFNVIARWARKFYYWLRNPRENAETIAYGKGYKKGYDDFRIQLGKAMIEARKNHHDI